MLFMVKPANYFHLVESYKDNLVEDMVLIDSPSKNLGDEACKVFHSAPHPLHVALNAGLTKIRVACNTTDITMALPGSTWLYIA